MRGWCKPARSFASANWEVWGVSVCADNVVMGGVGQNFCHLLSLYLNALKGVSGLHPTLPEDISNWKKKKKILWVPLESVNNVSEYR